MGSYDAFSDRELLVEIRKHTKQLAVEAKKAEWSLPISFGFGIVWTGIIFWLSRTIESTTGLVGVIVALFLVGGLTIRRAIVNSKAREANLPK